MFDGMFLLRRYWPNYDIKVGGFKSIEKY